MLINTAMITTMATIHLYSSLLRGWRARALTCMRRDSFLIDKKRVVQRKPHQQGKTLRKLLFRLWVNGRVAPFRTKAKLPIDQWFPLVRGLQTARGRSSHARWRASPRAWRLLVGTGLHRYFYRSSHLLAVFGYIL